MTGVRCGFPSLAGPWNDPLIPFGVLGISYITAEREELEDEPTIGRVVQLLK